MSKSTTFWQQFLNGLPLYAEDPPGYLPVSKYAERIESKHSTINKAVTDGRIPHSRCVAVPFGSGRRRLSIDWNGTAYDYIMTRREELRPSGFEPNVTKTFKPIEIGPAEATVDEVGAPAAPLLCDDMEFRPVTDLSAAKFREAQLKIIKAQTELRVINNELLKIADVIALVQEMAAATRASLAAFIRTAAPKLIGAQEAIQIQKILNAELSETFGAVEKIGEAYGGGPDEQHD